jgi:hypothetical protein
MLKFFNRYYVAKNAHRGTSMLSHSDIHPSKLSRNRFHTKFGLMRNSFEHSYFGALKNNRRNADTKTAGTNHHESTCCIVT